MSPGSRAADALEGERRPSVRPGSTRFRVIRRAAPEALEVVDLDFGTSGGSH